MAASTFFEQQPSLQSLPQHDEAVLSLPQFLQQDAAPLSFFMYDLPSLLQQDMASWPEQQESLAPFACLLCRAHIFISFEFISLEPDEDILSQQGHFSFCVLVGWSVEGVGVASCAHETAVRARMRAKNVCFIDCNLLDEFGFAGGGPRKMLQTRRAWPQGNRLRLSRRELRRGVPCSAGKEAKHSELRLGCAALAKCSDSESLCARTNHVGAAVLLAWMLSPQERCRGLSGRSMDADHRMASWDDPSAPQAEVSSSGSGGRGSRNDCGHQAADLQFGKPSRQSQTTAVCSSRPREQRTAPR